jgi:hypothetical protein
MNLGMRKLKWSGRRRLEHALPHLTTRGKARSTPSTSSTYSTLSTIRKRTRDSREVIRADTLSSTRERKIKQSTQLERAGTRRLLMEVDATNLNKARKRTRLSQSTIFIPHCTAVPIHRQLETRQQRLREGLAEEILGYKSLPAVQVGWQ